MNKISKILVNKNVKLSESMKLMNKYGFKCLILVDSEYKLYGTLSDGDIRKYLLNNTDKNIPSKKISKINCLFVKQGLFKKDDLISYFYENDVFAIPEIDDSKIVTKVYLKKDINVQQINTDLLNYNLVIMAGGYGKRIGKFTEILPKALLPIGDETIISKIINSYNDYGIRKITVSLNNKSQIIKSYLQQFKKKFKIDFIQEKKPLGTVGALANLKLTQMPIFLTNCDIYSNYNKSSSLNSHIKNKNDMTIIISKKTFNFDYGVCSLDKEGNLKSIKEKPKYSNKIIVGQYIINPKVIKLIPKNTEFNMNQLLDKLLKLNFKVGSFEINENDWLDVGKWNLYKESLKKLE